MLLKSAIRWGLQHGLPRLIIGRAVRRGDPQGLLIMDQGVRADPYPTLTHIRDRGPLTKGQLSYLTATHAVAREALRNDAMTVGVAATTSGPLSRLMRWTRDEDMIGPLDPPSLLAVEPPDHTRYRTLVSKVFTARAVEKLRGRTEEIAAGLLDQIAEAGPHTELISTYATLLPVTIIAEILGVPASERARVLRFGAGAAPSLDLGLSWKDFRYVENSLREFSSWLDGHLSELRLHPGEDLLSQLVTVEDEGRRLDDRELRATAGLLLAAGFETTVNLLGSGAELLMRHPDQLTVLQAEPSLWGNAVDEILRFESPVQVTARSAARDTVIEGTPVGAGSLVVMQLGGANRDPDVFADPDSFDVRRVNARDHLAFSGGRHFCLGAALARLEGEVGLRSLFDRFPELVLAPGAQRRKTRVLRGWEKLPVTTGAALALAGEE